MRAILSLCLVVINILIINGEYQNVHNHQRILSMNRNPFQPGFNQGSELKSFARIPFPQCFSTEKALSMLNPESIKKLFMSKLEEEDKKLKHERSKNSHALNIGIMDFDAQQLRSDTHNGALVARVATKVANELLVELGCDTNRTVSRELDMFLRKIRLPDDVCAFNPNPKCEGLTDYRTITGVCNNLQRPYEGSSQTAFARILPPAYDDGLSTPRSQSVLGGPLPQCRDISLTMDSKPVFDTSFNNFFVAYGQFLVHDIALATPVTDSGRTPITSCKCDSKDTEMCTVIPIPANDPFMAGQKCMALPASSQAFTDQICALGVKDQMNGDSHYIDLSATYGSTRQTALGLRVRRDGLLKSSKRSWSKFSLPPGQREGKSCSDATATNKCFAGGDSRLMENVLLSGLQSQWIRQHNLFVRELAKMRPDWKNNDDILYEEGKRILSALHQRYTYELWLPILIGPEAAQRHTGENGAFSKYNPSMPAVMFNEAATAALRLHTLVRDLFSRCRPNGQFIDQVWLHDITAKCKLAYDEKNNGVDSFICGALSDYGFAGDSNFAREVHHRLFENKNTKGELRRNDLVSINICRGRHHGITGYNDYRQKCSLRRATQFQDFADTMSTENIQKLQQVYKHVDDVDLFTGINFENHVPGGLVGPTSACIIALQFKHLKYGDRFFYKHEGQFTTEQLNAINKYSYSCFICHTTDIEKVAANPFRPPHDQTNPYQLCSQCPSFDFNPWRPNTRVFA